MFQPCDSRLLLSQGIRMFMICLQEPARAEAGDLIASSRGCSELKAFFAGERPHTARGFAFCGLLDWNFLTDLLKGALPRPDLSLFGCSHLIQIGYNYNHKESLCFSQFAN